MCREDVFSQSKIHINKFYRRNLPKKAPIDYYAKSLTHNVNRLLEKCRFLKCQIDVYGLNTITKLKPKQKREKSRMNGTYEHNKSSPVSMSNDYKYGNFF